MIHNSKLAKLLETSYKVQHNPNHIYLTFLTYYIYIIFVLLSNINDMYGVSFYISNTLSYSLFLLEPGQ